MVSLLSPLPRLSLITFAFTPADIGCLTVLFVGIFFSFFFFFSFLFLFLLLCSNCYIIVIIIKDIYDAADLRKNMTDLGACNSKITIDII